MFCGSFLFNLTNIYNVYVFYFIRGIFHKVIDNIRFVTFY